MRTHNLIKAVAISTLALFSVLATACAAQPKDPIELVPARAELLASIDLPAVLTDADVNTMYEMVAAAADDPEVPATLSALLEKAQTEIGLDVAEFGEVLAFADLPSTDASDLQYAGVIAAGAPDGLLDKIVETSQQPVTDGEYNGVRVLTGPDGETLIAVVDGSAVAGTVDAVHDVIDIVKSGGSAVSGDLLDFYNELGDVWVKVATVLPDDLKQQLASTDAGDAGIPLNLGDALKFEAAALTANKVGSEGILRIVLRYPTADAAASTEETIKGLMTFATMFGGEDPGISDALDALDISTDGSDLIIEVRRDVQQAMDDLQSMLESFGDPSSLGIGF